MNTDGFMPHGHCFLWEPALLWVNVVSDSLTALAYLTIPVTLVYFARQRRDVPFNGVFVAFGVFILACGATHVMDIWTIWTPAYWIAGVVKAVTAGASVTTAVLLVKIVPGAMRIPSQQQLIDLNAKLTHEVEERRRALGALHRDAERFRALVDQVQGYAIFMLDPAGRVATWNAGAERMKGYQADEILGQSFAFTFTPEDVALGKPQEILTLATVNGRHESEEWRVRKGGSRYMSSLVITALYDSSGGLLGFSEVSRDISELKAYVDTLEQKTRDLKRSNEELEQFAYVASHDLQEPLRMVESYTQLLAQRYKGRLDASADEFIGFAVDGAHRMRRLIQDLLAYCRIGSEGKVLRRTSSESALARALVNLKVSIEASGAVITHDPLPIVLADDSQLVQLFQNLVGNAIKYHGVDAPRIHVGSATTGLKEWTFAVRDNGLGIAAEHFHRVFLMFQRLHGRKDYDGTGIGLSVCKKIVERHGGRMWVESEAGHGSTFQFTIPQLEAV